MYQIQTLQHGRQTRMPFEAETFKTTKIRSREGKTDFQKYIQVQNPIYVNQIVDL